MARRRQGKKIDFTRWDGGFQTALALSAGSVAATSIAAGILPTTLLRMRGELVAYVDAASAPPTLAEIGVGLHLVPEGTGTTVLNSPLTDRTVLENHLNLLIGA